MGFHDSLHLCLLFMEMTFHLPGNEKRNLRAQNPQASCVVDVHKQPWIGCCTTECPLAKKAEESEVLKEPQK